ncbi:MAG: substrate-binding domain-containing protein [Desulfovibrio sp.]|nr:substrate-binding domain-containing protein [Desulfovibrio sp.]MBI4959867.1 substrate-binding domain-containing protein [Desulfovibrio sp.]
MRSLVTALLLVLVSFAQALAVPVENPFAGLSGELRITGSDVGLIAAREAAEKIMAQNPSVKITFTLTGPGMGLRRVRFRQADICLYDRNPPEAHQQQGASLSFVAYGVDPVVVVVNPVNTVGPLSIDQLRLLFSAKIRTWESVGGGSYPVMPIYIEASEIEGKPDTKPGNVSVSSQPAMRFTLGRNKETLGFISMRDLDATLKPVALEGVAPDLEAFKAGRYRVYRLMYAAMGTDPSPLAAAFMRYMAGPQGQALLEATGYLPLAAKPAWETVLPVGEPDRIALGW